MRAADRVREWSDCAAWSNLRPSKIINAARYLLARRWPRAGISYLPLFYMVGTGETCRLRCRFCVRGAGASESPLSASFLEIETFRIVLQQIRGAALVLDLFKHGEPLFHPQLPELVVLANQAGVRCRVSTGLNANFDDGYAQRLMTSGLYRLTCAIDGTTQDAYEQYRQGGDLRLVLENAARLLACARRGGPQVVWRMLVFGWNHHQVDEARERAASMGFHRFRADGGFFAINGETVQWDIARAAWVPAEWHRNSVGLSPLARPRKSPQPCRSLLAHAVLHSDGRLAPCCHASRADWLAGSVTGQGLAQVWNSPIAVASREYTLGLSGDRNAAYAACQHCPWL